MYKFIYIYIYVYVHGIYIISLGKLQQSAAFSLEGAATLPARRLRRRN